MDSEDRKKSCFTESTCRQILELYVTEYQTGWVPIEFANGSVDEQGDLPNYWLSLEQISQPTEDAACFTHVEAQPEMEYI